MPWTIHNAKGAIHMLSLPSPIRRMVVQIGQAANCTNVRAQPATTNRINLNIVAVDVATVSPPQDVNNMAAHLCAHVVYEMLSLLCRQFGLASSA